MIIVLILILLFSSVNASAEPIIPFGGCARQMAFEVKIKWLPISYATYNFYPIDNMTCDYATLDQNATLIQRQITNLQVWYDSTLGEQHILYGRLLDELRATLAGIQKH
jgi:hypothetical protein